MNTVRSSPSRWLRRLVIAAAITAVFGVASTAAYADPITLENPTATFSGTNGTNPTYLTTGCTGSPATACETRWGIASNNQNNRSGMRFDVFSSPLNSSTGATFQLGVLTHENWPLQSNSAASQTKLSFAFNITTPNLGAQSFNFSFDINETPNQQQGCANTPTIPGNWCPDIITFGSSTSTTTFDIDGVKYTLHLLGFGNDPTNPMSQFITQESANNKTPLWATIDVFRDPTNVPEPGALGMMGLGVLGIGLAFGLSRRRRSLRGD